MCSPPPPLLFFFFSSFCLSYNLTPFTLPFFLSQHSFFNPSSFSSLFSTLLLFSHLPFLATPSSHFLILATPSSLLFSFFLFHLLSPSPSSYSIFSHFFLLPTPSFLSHLLFFAISSSLIFSFLLLYFLSSSPSYPFKLLPSSTYVLFLYLVSLLSLFPSFLVYSFFHHLLILR